MIPIMGVGALTISIGFFTGLFIGVRLIDWWRSKRDQKPVHEPKKIAYPLEGMFNYYCDILEEIDQAQNISDLNSAYVYITIFTSEFPDSGKFASELMYMYDLKEIDLRAHDE